ncbi:protein S40-2-like [Silene latifolia]|uniref:protein S40-2-like n=1 Tax=Silene latifolia TaxID=37657 RepID=UPI003D779D3C
MEFQESDIMFSNEYSSSNQINPIGYYNSVTTSKRGRNRVTKKQNEGQRSPTVPLNIPGSSSSSPSSSFRYDGHGFDSFSDDFLDDNELVPPHVIVDRRSSGSNMNGKGKKKNLIHFRNSVLKLTGFLES